MEGIQVILSTKHQIEDAAINLFKFVSKLQDDELLEKEERVCLHNVVDVCIEILEKLNRL